MAGLMIQAQAGDRQAYHALLVIMQRWLERYFRRRVAPTQLDDLVQEVMMAVHEKRSSWDPSRAFLPWLAAIARYRWLDHLRALYRSSEEVLEEEAHAAPAEEEPLVAHLSLQKLLARLPGAQRQVITLVKLDGLSVAEASARTGQSESLVKVNIHRGLKRLTAFVEEVN